MLHAIFITDHFNYCIVCGEILDELKHADVLPVHKKNENSENPSYKPVSIIHQHLENL